MNQPDLGGIPVVLRKCLPPEAAMEVRDVGKFDRCFLPAKAVDALLTAPKESAVQLCERRKPAVDSLLVLDDETKVLNPSS